MNEVRRVVERYNYELWNEQAYEIAPEIIGDELVRHSPGSRVVLSHDDAVERVRQAWREFSHIKFTLPHVVTEGDQCAIVYQAEMRKRDGAPLAIASVEVFRVYAGKIVEVWNNAHQIGRWPELEGVQA